MDKVFTISNNSTVLRNSPTTMNILRSKGKVLCNNPLRQLVKRQSQLDYSVAQATFKVKASSSSGEDPSKHPEGSDVAKKQGSEGKGQVVRVGRKGLPPFLRRSPLNAIIGDIWDPLFPYRDMKQMLNSVDRIFEDFLPSRIFGEDLPGVSALTSTPRLSWDIRETDNEYELHADVPGLKKEDLKVRIENENVLVISGERKVEDEDDQWKQRRYVNYQTSLVLPDNANADGIEAELNHGVLELKIPKLEKEEQKPHVKEIPVK